MLSTKDYILSYLLEQEDFISGEILSSRLEISRAAVNTAVKALRSEGYNILSSTKKGYKIIDPPDKTGYGELLHYLPEDRVKLIHSFDEVSSTNDTLKQLSFDGAPGGTVVIADYQSKGKGRRGRSFDSPHGTGVYFSYLMRPSIAPADASQITARTAVAVCRAIRRSCGIDPQIKWVNDLVAGSKKVTGILTEMTFESESGTIDSIVIGIGINVDQKETDFPEDIRDIAGSLMMAKGEYIRRAPLVAALTEEMDILSSSMPDGTSDYLSEYRKRCLTLGKEVSVVKVHDSGEVPRHGTAVDINPDFSLKVRFEDGHEEDLMSGEVSVRGLYGYI
ncbi:MAG: biotin--[Clostridiales bacterium]|nr:biotin--[acetyl-CoA-carboxylase] ligase [Clostridiales bacterium]MBR6483545.1 biotin--[acetyl-CoA-carboxylase] ligase [Clostridiales bacterium]